MMNLAPGGASAVLLWHAAARDAIVRQRPNQQVALRLLAYLSLAQQRAAEALTASTGKPREAEWSAAFDAASADTIGALLPAEAPAMRALASALAASRKEPTPNGDAERAQEIGRKAASQTIERAVADGFDSPWRGELPSDATRWHSLLEPARPPHLPALGSMKPVFLGSGSASRPAPPPAVGSAAFDTALAEVRTRASSSAPEGLARARRWEMATGSLVAGFWDEVAISLAARNGLSGATTARVLATTMGAAMDANIACHDAKYTYWMPRPSQVDPSIKPRIGLPNHPSYPSNHSCDSGAAADVLGKLFPAYHQALASMAIDASESRIDAGIHYRFDMDAGLAIGRAAASAALAAQRVESQARGEQ